MGQNLKECIEAYKLGEKIPIQLGHLSINSDCYQILKKDKDNINQEGREWMIKLKNCKRI